MQSRNAYILGSFVIPEGATTGARIEFDAENGVILIYNTSDELVATLGTYTDPDSDVHTVITAYSINSSLEVQHSGFGLQAFSHGTTHPMEYGGLVIFSNPEGSTAQPPSLELAAPGIDNGDQQTNILLLGQSEDGTFTNRIRYGTKNSASGSMAHEFRGYCYAATGRNESPDVADWAREDWNNLTMNNSWVTDVETPGYKMMADGTILLRGNMKDGTTVNGTTVATLPAGYRPATAQRFITAEKQTGLSWRHIGIGTDGTLKVWNATTAHICLDGVRFPII